MGVQRHLPVTPPFALETPVTPPVKPVPLNSRMVKLGFTRVGQGCYAFSLVTLTAGIGEYLTNKLTGLQIHLRADAIFFVALAGLTIELWGFYIGKGSDDGEN